MSDVSQGNGLTPLRNYGRATLAANGQISLPKSLREDWAIMGTSVPVHVFARADNREILLLQEPSNAADLADALRAANRK